MGGKFFVRMKFDGSDVRKISFGSISNRGARNYQEDSFGFSSFEKEDVKNFGFTAVVADGMGGLSNGDKISGYVVSSMLEMIKSRTPDIPMHIYLSRALKAVNGSVLASGIKGGSTAVVVTCQPSGVHWCTAGDSRVYLFREGKLTALNEDSDYLNDLIEQVIAGDMTFEEAGENSKKDALAQYIGFKGGINPDGNSKPFIPQRGDKLLLCSDGVYNALTKEELIQALSLEAAEAAQLIENRVLSKGYSTQDNFTAVVLEFFK
ncbi:MAG: protein phosphatase 2C domain-containing protein [Ruminococcus sp.]|nr:protein phosphatase 2C domain-containing protein [Ruminococcus sp.]MCM1380440.1 protein phosphatase 2C domain-containing protein [Muribaculaceae bacterium]MCM1478410.1 protein phosphatase 2C domain-containing protein [Muribaculaceae bacterium]